MELKGKVIKILPEQTGEGKNGTWVKNSFVIETNEERYPKKIAFQIFKELNLNKGDDVTVYFDIESREYNGKWYTSATAWKIEAERTVERASDPAANYFKPNINDDSNDELPF